MVMEVKRVLIMVVSTMVMSEGLAVAEMASGTAEYSITLVDSCSIDTTGASTDFGAHPVDSDPLADVPSGAVEVSCTTGISYRLGMDGGLNFMGSPTMLDSVSGAFIYYDILASGIPLGDNGLSELDPAYPESNPSPCINGVGISSPIIYDLTAEVGLNSVQASPAGNYTDVVTFTVAW